MRALLLVLLLAAQVRAAELVVPPSSAAGGVPLTGGTLSGAITAPQVNINDQLYSTSAPAMQSYVYSSGTSPNGLISLGAHTLTVTGDVMNYTGSNYLSTLHIDHNFGGPGMKGSRAGIDLSMIMQGTSSNTNNNAQYYVGIADYVNCGFNDNGISTAFANVAGSCVGFNPISDIGTGTNWYTLDAEEIDVRSTSGSSVAHTFGTLNVKSGTGARGIYDDAAMAFVNANGSTWKTIFQIGKTDGTPATASDTTLLACQSPVATTTPCSIGSGVDLTNFSITTAAFASPGFFVNGTGAVTMKGHLTNTGPAPAVATCGTSPSLSSTASDRHGTITPGSGASACTVTFQSAYGAAPDCVLTGWAANTMPFVSSASPSSLTVGFGNVGRFTYLCEQ